MRWSQLVEQFVKSADVDTKNLDALHRFRISSKKLRYGMELLAPAFDPQRIERAYGFVERLQEGLGQIHDHVFAGRMFHDWDKKRNRVSRECNLKLLIKGEDIMLRNELSDLGTWWTPAVMADMRQAFDLLAILDSHGG
jgi:CHAD domain-containing protein